MAPRSSTATDTEADGRVPVLVLFHAYNWTERDPDTKDRVYFTAQRGTIARVFPAERERALALGAVADPPEDPSDLGQVQAVLAGATRPTAGSMSDDQLRALTTEELVAYVNQNPGELARVIALEGARQATTGAAPRPEVMALVDSTEAQRLAMEAGQTEADRRAALEAEAAAGQGGQGGQGGNGGQGRGQGS